MTNGHGKAGDKANSNRKTEESKPKQEATTTGIAALPERIAKAGS